MTATGPLIVFAEVLDGGEPRGHLWVTQRRLYVLDSATGQHWAAFDYEHVVRTGPAGTDLTSVQVAGTSLVVWSGDQVRRLALNGVTESVLFRHDQITTVRVSPDGSKVAIAYDRPISVTVLDVASGYEIVSLAGDDARMGALRERVTEGPLTLGDWSADGSTISLDGPVHEGWDVAPNQPDQRAILSLDGELREAPREWRFSPDLRYALRPGERVRLDAYLPGGLNDVYLWETFEVIDAATNEILWTVEVEGDGGIIPYDSSTWRWDGPLQHVIWRTNPDRYVFFEYSGLPSHIYEPIRAGASFAWSAWHRGRQGTDVAARVLDLEGGTTRALSHAEWIASLDRRVVRDCYHISSQSPCVLVLDGRVVWEGFPEFVGLIETAEPVAVSDVTPEYRRAWTVAAPPDAPPPGEMVGPLLIYTIWAGAEYVKDEVWAPQLRARERVMAYDEGTARRWMVLEGIRPPVLTAGTGLVVGDGHSVNFIEPDGTVEAVLIEGLPERERLSALVPALEGRRLVAIIAKDEAPDDYIHGGEGYGPVSYRLVVFDLPSGRVLTEAEFGDLGGFTFISRWSEDDTAFSVSTEGYQEYTLNAVVNLATARSSRPPEGVMDERHLSADFRHAVRGWLVDSQRYYWGFGDYIQRDERAALEIIEYETERVVWQSPHVPGRFLESGYWAWLSADQFAWSSGAHPDLFNFHTGFVESGAERAAVSILTVSTGEVEDIDSAEYIERREAQLEQLATTSRPRASVECHDDRTLPCQVRLDGQVVDGGRFAKVIGFVELE